METNKIVYVRCTDSAIVVHTVYASGYDATDAASKVIQLETLKLMNEEDGLI